MKKTPKIMHVYLLPESWWKIKRKTIDCVYICKWFIKARVFLSSLSGV